MDGFLTIAAVHMSVPLQVVILGAITGTAYSLFAMGLSLSYQSARVINFAQGAMGAVPALFVASRVIDHGWSYWIAIPTGLALGAGTGALMEVVVIRRLAHASRLVVLVATIAVAQLLLIPGQFMVNLSHTKLGSRSFPVPFRHVWKFASLRLKPGDRLVLLVVPVVAIGLTYFMRRTNVGMASRAMAENREAAELAGVPVRQVSLVVWATAGLLAALAGILLGPAQPVLAGLFGTGGSGAISNDSDLLLRGLGAAMIGGLISLPQVFVAGIGLGVVEALVQWNYPNGGAVSLVVVALIIGSLMLRSDLRQLARGGEESSWSLAGTIGPLSQRLRRLPRVRQAHLGALGVFVAVAIFVPWAASPSQRILFTAICLFAVMALSLVILTGWAGQVSLGQFAFAGLGALVGGRMQQLGYPMFGGLMFAVAAGVIAAFIVGLPALRLRGLFLAVTTLALAVLLDGTLTHQKWLVNAAGNGSLLLRRPNAHGINFNDELTYYYLILAITVATLLVVHHLRHTGVARKFMAVRDNEPMAAAVGIGPAETKLTAFVLSGCIAAAAGYFYGTMLINTSGAVTDPSFSLTIMTMAVIGGMTSVTGAVLGALYIRGIPYFVHSTAVQLLSSGGGLLLVILLFPAGLSTVAFRLRDWVVNRIVGADHAMAEDGSSLAPGGGRVDRSTVAPRVRLTAMASRATGADAADHGLAVLEARSIEKTYGGLTALDGVSLRAERGEIVGILGPNGAGKTTLFDILSGLVVPDAGEVLLRGQDITRFSPHARARLGLGRSFQQARLFDALTVREVIMVVLEREDPTELVPSLLGLPPSRAAERRKRTEADEILRQFGLDVFAERTAAELSTGTRRIAELACTAALGANVVLLDEPTGGIAQREVEAFTPVLRQLREHLDATMIVIAHDVPMMVGLVDRLYVMASGRVIAEGSPSDVTRDPLVISAYLGDDEGLVAPPPRRRTRRPSLTAAESS